VENHGTERLHYEVGLVLCILFIIKFDPGGIWTRIFLEDFFISQRKFFHFELFNLFKESDGGQVESRNEIERLNEALMPSVFPLASLVVSRRYSLISCRG
jgi:hypothetical protein